MGPIRTKEDDLETVRSLGDTQLLRADLNKTKLKIAAGFHDSSGMISIDLVFHPLSTR